MLSLLLIIPGVIVAYAFFIRPLLEKMPKLKAFYAEADGFWAKLWAICGKSVTMAWSYVLVAVSGVLSQLDGIAATLGDPNFKQQVADFVHGDPKILGYFGMAVSLITIASRLRSLAK